MIMEIQIDGKAIYSAKGPAAEYGKVGCNFYIGCPLSCEYCYNKRGFTAKVLGGNEVTLKKCLKDEDNAIEIFFNEMRKHLDYLRENGVFFSFTTDPLIPETIDLTISAMDLCIYNDIPVKLLTKNADFISYDRMKLFLNSDHMKKLVSFGFTLTGRDDMEPNASTNQERIETMRTLHTRGCKTWASIEPVIDWESSRKVVEASLDCCDHYKIGLRSGVGRDYYNIGESASALNDLVLMIDESSRTVYLKNSAIKLLEKAYHPEYLKWLLSHTVDRDDNPLFV